MVHLLRVIFLSDESASIAVQVHTSPASCGAALALGTFFSFA
jgi:hypothetical protein